MDKLPTVENGLFCCSLKDGTIGISIIYIVFGILMIICGVFDMVYEDGLNYGNRKLLLMSKFPNMYCRTETYLYNSLMICALVLLIISILLLLGVSLKEGGLVKMWIYCGLICCIVQFIWLLVVIVVGIIDKDKIFWLALIFHFDLLYSGFLFYSILVVNSYHKSS